MSDVPASCQPFDEDLSALVDEELGPEREAEVRAHLAGCSRCAQRLEALCDVDLTLAGLPAPEVPGDLRARLAARIAAEPARIAAEPEAPRAAAPPPPRRAPPPRRRSRSALWMTAAAAALALAVWVAVRSEPGVAPQAPLARTPAPAPEAVPTPVPDPPALLVAVEEPPEAPAGPEEPAPAPTPVAVEQPTPAPAPPEPALEAPLQVAEAGLPELADLEEADVALLLELDAVQDLEVIANLDLLERFLALEERRGAG